jgi:hypothetical protein
MKGDMLERRRLSPANLLRFAGASIVAAIAVGACNEFSGADRVAGPDGTTGAIFADVTPPTVTILQPLNGATGVAPTAPVVIQFSETMNTSTINSSTFTVAPSGGSPVAGTIVFHGSNTVAFNVSSPMTAGVTYIVNVTSGAKDLAGNGVNPPLTTSFTIAGGDVTPPTVTAVSPVNAATNVAGNSSVIVTFSEAMNAATVTTSTFTLSPTSGGGAVAASVSYNPGNLTATLVPSSALVFSTSYTVNVTNGAKDVAGNGLTAFSSSFTTAAAPDVTPPTVTAVKPHNDATKVAVKSSVVVTIREEMSAATV